MAVAGNGSQCWHTVLAPLTHPAPAVAPPPPPRSKMALNDKLHFTDLRLPPGCALHRVNQQLPILKVAK